MQTVQAYPNETACWYQLVIDAQAFNGQFLNTELESYLVFMLQRFTKKRQWLKQALAVDYLKTEAVTAKARAANLREIGDKCLLIAGLFPQQAKQRCVSSHYFIELGRQAYHHLSLALTNSGNLYANLGGHFVQLVAVLAAFRQLEHAKFITQWR